ncbi:hypothetical protein JCM1841_005903 [Sporobolomyces salmonicolor]
MQQDALAHALATAVTETYSSLPPNGKPTPRSNGQPQWTVLAGFCLYRDSHAPVCVSLGTGLKSLPHAKLPVHGDVLHDSHAEIIAKRGFKLWIYAEMDRALKGDAGVYVERASDGWRIRTGWEVGMWVSTLPCGDASTYALSLASASSSSTAPAAPPVPCPTFELLPSPPSLHPSLVRAASLGLVTSRSPAAPPSALPGSPSATLAAAGVHRGRASYTSLGTLRTKPGRADSPPTTSHSCSDKLALWALVGLQGGLLSSLRVERVRLGCLAVSGVKGAEEYRERVRDEVRRAVGGRLEGWVGPAGERAAVPRVELVEVEFEHSREAVAREYGVEEDEALSCQESLSWVQGLGTEVITNGIRQGAASKRKPGEPLGPKARSRLSKLSLFQRHLELQPRALSPSSSPDSVVGLSSSATYFSTKHGTASSSSSASYPALKAAVRARPTAPPPPPPLSSEAGPFAAWLVSGEKWESFDAEGRVRECGAGGAGGGGKAG